jgi:hypothetical protein
MGEDHAVAAALAVVSAALFALGAVLQQRGAMAQEGGGAAIMLQLARKPVWLAGIAAYAVAYAVQAAALGEGQLVVVQPILATTIVFALPLGAWISDQVIRRRDVAAAIAVTAGLALFLLLADPAGGREDAPGGQWILACAIVLTAVAALTIAGRTRSGAMRAALFGTAAGLTFGLVSALTKGAVEILEDGDFGELLSSWHTYAILVLGYIGMTLVQWSLQAGVLPPAVATSSIFNPALSIVLGLTLFQESIHRDAVESVAAGLSLAAMFAGVAVLSLRDPAEPEPEI